eukprot:2719416-Rhodomonas_salina.1
MAKKERTSCCWWSTGEGKALRGTERRVENRKEAENEVSLEAMNTTSMRSVTGKMPAGPEQEAPRRARCRQHPSASPVVQLGGKSGAWTATSAAASTSERPSLSESTRKAMSGLIGPSGERIVVNECC